MDKNVDEIINKIKETDNNVVNIIIPMLKDTVEDYRKITFKLIATIVVLVIGIIFVGIVSQIIVSKQIDKYNDFLSQFEYESSVYQDMTSTDNSILTVNSGINYTK